MNNTRQQVQQMIFSRFEFYMQHVQNLGPERLYPNDNSTRQAAQYAVRDVTLFLEALKEVKK